jgi:hypothetical protein
MVLKRRRQGACCRCSFIVCPLQRRGLLEEGNVDPRWEAEPLLATITAASIQGQVATGDRAGQRVRRRLIDPEEGVRSGPLCFASRGFSLHAATCPWISS